MPYYVVLLFGGVQTSVPLVHLLNYPSIFSKKHHYHIHPPPSDIGANLRSASFDYSLCLYIDHFVFPTSCYISPLFLPKIHLLIICISLLQLLFLLSGLQISTYMTSLSLSKSLILIFAYQ